MSGQPTSNQSAICKSCGETFNVDLGHECPGIQPRASKDQLYYLQVRGYCGNSVLWWRKGRCGYTADIQDAHVFTKDEAFGQQRCRPDEDFPWRKDYIDSILQSHVHCEHLDRDVESSFVATHEPSAAQTSVTEIIRQMKGRAADSEGGTTIEVLLSDLRSVVTGMQLAGAASPPPASRAIDLIADDAYAATFQTMAQYRRALLEALRVHQPPSVWQPIETAPPTDRNNPVYVAYPRFNNVNRTMVPDEYICFTAYRDNLGWDTGFWRLHEMPHYWHPLPTPPTVMRDGLQIERPSETKVDSHEG